MRKYRAKLMMLAVLGLMIGSSCDAVAGGDRPDPVVSPGRIYRRRRRRPGVLSSGATDTPSRSRASIGATIGASTTVGGSGAEHTGSGDIAGTYSAIGAGGARWRAPASSRRTPTA